MKFDIRFILLGVVLLLVLGIAGCPEKTGEVPGPSENGNVDFERLPEMNSEVYRSTDTFTVYPPSCVSVLQSGDPDDKYYILGVYQNISREVISYNKVETLRF